MYMYHLMTTNNPVWSLQKCQKGQLSFTSMVTVSLASIFSAVPQSDRSGNQYDLCSVVPQSDSKALSVWSMQ